MSRDNVDMYIYPLTLSRKGVGEVGGEYQHDNSIQSARSLRGGVTSPQPSCSRKARGSRFESGNSKTGKRGENARGKIEDGGGRP